MPVLFWTERKRSSRWASAFSRRSLPWPAGRKPRASWPASEMRNSRPGNWGQRSDEGSDRSPRERLSQRGGGRACHGGFRKSILRSSRREEAHFSGNQTDQSLLTSAATNFESALRAWLRAKLVRIFLSRQAST